MQRRLTKYPRIVDFTNELTKTISGKIKRNSCGSRRGKGKGLPGARGGKENIGPFGPLPVLTEAGRSFIML